MPFNKHDHSIAGKIRPRFKIIAHQKMEPTMNAVYEHSKSDTTIITSKFLHFIKLQVPENEQHYWSPVLSISFEEEENETIIRGIIGPNEKVWTMFVFIYSLLGVIGLFGTIYAFVQYQVYDNPFFLNFTPLAPLLLASVFITSKQGKNKANPQMIHLLKVFRRSVDAFDFEIID